MKRLAIDLRSPPRWGWGHGLAGGLAMLLALAGVAGTTVLHARVTEERRQLEALHAQRIDHAAPRPAASAPKPYGASANEMRNQQQGTWPFLLTALETVQIDGVRLNAIEISARERSVRADIEYDQFVNVLRYLEALNAGEEASNHWKLTQAQSNASKPAVSAPQDKATASLLRRW